MSLPKRQITISNMNNIYIYTAPFLMNHSAKKLQKTYTKHTTNCIQQVRNKSNYVCENMWCLRAFLNTSTEIKERTSMGTLFHCFGAAYKKALSVAEATVELWIWIQVGETNHLLSAVYHALVCTRSSQM